MAETDQAGAVLQYMELVARGRPPDDEDHESAYDTMMSCVKSLGSQLRVLKDQASAGWRGDFNAVLDSAHSMRLVEIELGDKDPRKQQMQRCDACGRMEYWCGKAIDLAGGSHEPADWMEKCHEIPQQWEEFKDEYQGVIDTPDNGNFRHCDLGRFYIGKTCLRKAKLHFIISTFLPELVYHAWTETRDLAPAEINSDGLFTVDDDAELEFTERRTQLDLCVSQENRADMPDVLVDESFWEVIDTARANYDDERMLVIRTEDSLRRGAERAGIAARPWQSELPSARGNSDDEEGDGTFRPGPSGRRDDEEEFEDEAESDDGLSPRKRRQEPKAHRPRKSRRVIEDDSEDEEPQEPRSRAKGAAPTRASRRQQGLAADTEVAAAAPAPAAGLAVLADDDDDDDEEGEEHEVQVEAPSEEDDEENTRVCDLADVRRQRPPIPPSRAARAGPSAQRTAIAMRIPPVDGTPAALPSRRAVLLSIMDLARKLTTEGRDGDASTLDAAVVTMRELMEIAERARGTGSSR